MHSYSAIPVQTQITGKAPWNLEIAQNFSCPNCSHLIPFSFSFSLTGLSSRGIWHWNIHYIFLTFQPAVVLHLDHKSKVHEPLVRPRNTLQCSWLHTHLLILLYELPLVPITEDFLNRSIDSHTISVYGAFFGFFLEPQALVTILSSTSSAFIWFAPALDSATDIQTAALFHPFCLFHPFTWIQTIKRNHKWFRVINSPEQEVNIKEHHYNTCLYSTLIMYYSIIKFSKVLFESI